MSNEGYTQVNYNAINYFVQFILTSGKITTETIAYFYAI